jgi:FlgD Ig-like domain
MPSLRRLAWTAPVLLALAVPLAHAAVPTAPADGTVELRSASAVRSAKVQQQLAQSDRWSNFRARAGAWKAVWNEETRTPHRAYGPAVGLANFTDTEGGADRAVRGFISQNPDLFGGRPSLELAKATRVNDLWYVRYRQTVAGIPVLHTDWEFRVGANGKLMMFGADAHAPSSQLVTSPRIPLAVAREAARNGLEFDAARDRIEGGDLYILPYSTAAGLEYRLVYEVWVRTVKPRGNWKTLVDAHSGEILMRRNRIFAAISGTVNGQVHLNLPTDALTTRAFNNALVTVGAVVDSTNVSGFYTANVIGTQQVQAGIRGPYVDVERCVLDICPSNEAFFTATAANPATVNISWTISNSQNSERDAFYHVNLARDHVKSIDPAFHATDYAMLCYVDHDDHCNAFWDGFALQFLSAGDGCPATAQMPDFIYHEYGHAINDNLYFSQGVAAGMDNYALQEGTADIYATLMQNNPQFGKGIFGVGTIARTVDNTYQYPDKQNPVSAHETGLIVAGAMWDVRDALGITTARRLAHFAKYGTPDDLNDGVALSEYFIEVLVADDNDGNLANGTPNYTAIINAFNAHGIGTNYFIDIDVTADDMNSIGPFPVNAVITYSGPVGALDTFSPIFYYSVNDGPFSSFPMFPTGNPDEYGAQVPQQASAIIRYYVQAATEDGGIRIEPWGAPTRTHRFIGGLFTLMLENNFETDQGWTVGAPTDSATTGVWERAAPELTNIQPAADHSATGTLCYVTDHRGSFFPGDWDVDGGNTTLTSNTFNALSGGYVRPVVSYYRWYTNNGGDNPAEDDPLIVQISSNAGTNWTTVESTLIPDRSWYRAMFFIHNYVTPTANMRVRFIATDKLLGSLVEALIDDFAVYGFDPNVAVEDPQAAGTFALARPSPNPLRSTTTLRYRTAERGRVELKIFDIQGRTIRSVVDGEVEPGEHTAVWDGRDDRGRIVPNGPYFARLSQRGERASEAVVVLR